MYHRYGFSSVDGYGATVRDHALEIHQDAECIEYYENRKSYKIQQNTTASIFENQSEELLQHLYSKKYRR